MASAGGFNRRIMNIFVYQNDANGMPLTIADGGTPYHFSGKEGDFVEVGPTFQTIAAINTECQKRAAENRVSGSDMSMQFACGFNRPEFDSFFLNGWTRNYTEDGQILPAIAKPGEDDCFSCSKNPEAEVIDPTKSMIVDICVEDCEGNPIGREFTVIRNIKEAVLGNRKRLGGGNSDNLGGTINITLGSNDGFGEGPGDIIRAYDAAGDPACESVTCNVPCPADLDLSALDALACECIPEFSGCAITPEILAANPAYDIPLITGVA